MNGFIHELKKRPHPALVHFPIALYPISLLFLVLYWFVDTPAYLSASYWTFLAGAGFVIPVAATGLHDMKHLKQISHHAKEHLNTHLKNGIAITLISIFSGVLFLWQSPFENQLLFVLYTLNLALLTLLVMWQGYLGASMVYDHHLGISGETR